MNNTEQGNRLGLELGLLFSKLGWVCSGLGQGSGV